MKTNKYTYLKVIQQNYGQGWEDVSEYETNSTYLKLEQCDQLTGKGRKTEFVIS